MSGRPEILVRWDGSALMPVGWTDRDGLARIEPGTTFEIRKWEEGTRAARAFISVFIEIAAENHPDHVTADWLKGEIKKSGGFTTGERTEVDGSKADTLLSIGKMDKATLARFTEHAKHYVEFTLDMDAEAIAAEAMERIRPRRARS